MISGGVTIPSATGTVSFTVSGTQNLAYANSFFSGISQALSAGSLNFRSLSDPGESIPGYTPSATATATEQEVSSPGNYTLPADTTGGAVYTFVAVNGATAITGSGTGDNIMFASGDTSSSATYVDTGGSNAINFVDGNDIYTGDPTSSTGTDTIIAGSGNDTISTGAGAAVIDSGSGKASIMLQDTIAAAATDDRKSINPADYNQFVNLNGGADTVTLSGVADVAVAAAADQTIYTGGSGVALIALMPQTGGASGSDTVAGSGTGTTGLLSVYDASDGNHISGGAAPLVAVFADGTSGTVYAGTGTNDVYGNTADTVTLVSQDHPASFVFVAGDYAGESVDGSAASNVTMVLGTGNETLIGGNNTQFNANYDSATGLTGSITIDNFGGTDLFDFVGYSATQYEAALATGTLTGGDYQITLSDDTKVTFIGVTSITGHTANG